MPLLATLMGRFAQERPFDGLSVAACLHITAETAMLVRLLQAGGQHEDSHGQEPAAH